MPCSEVCYVQASRHRLGEDEGVCGAPGQSQPPLVKLQPWCPLTWVCWGPLGAEAVTTRRPRTWANPPRDSRRLLSPHLPSAWDLITTPPLKPQPFLEAVTPHNSCLCGPGKGALLPLLQPACLPPSPRLAAGTWGLPRRLQGEQRLPHLPSAATAMGLQLEGCLWLLLPASLPGCLGHKAM